MVLVWKVVGCIFNYYLMNVCYFFFELYLFVILICVIIELGFVYFIWFIYMYYIRNNCLFRYEILVCWLDEFYVVVLVVLVVLVILFREVCVDLCRWEVFLSFILLKWRVFLLNVYMVLWRFFLCFVLRINFF